MLLQMGSPNSGVSTHSGARRQYIIWGPCLTCHKSECGGPNITSVPNSVNDILACCDISFTADIGVRDGAPFGQFVGINSGRESTLFGQNTIHV